MLMNIVSYYIKNDLKNKAIDRNKLMIKLLFPWM